MVATLALPPPSKSKAVSGLCWWTLWDWCAGVAGTPASTPGRDGATPDGRVLDAVSSDENSRFSKETRSRSYAKCCLLNVFTGYFDFSNVLRLCRTRRGDNVGFALNQPIPKNTVGLRYDISITDSCIGWEAM
jgi:hypothetical protein